MARLSRSCLILTFAYMATAMATSTASSSCKECFNAALVEIAREAWTTLETAVRGFLLGFGTAIIKDMCFGDAKKASQEEFQLTMRSARMLGLGVASFMVGVAIILPARLRYELFALPQVK